MPKKKRWYRLDREPDYIMQLLSQKATSVYRECRRKDASGLNPFQRGKAMSIIKKLIEFKNSETFIIVIKIAKLLWRLFRKEVTDGNNQTGSNNL